MSFTKKTTLRGLLAIAAFGIVTLAGPSPAAATQSDCVGPAAIESLTYKVDGKEVSGLAGNVKSGSTAEAIVTLKAECSTTQLGFAAYKTTSNQWESDKADEQELARVATLKKSGTLRVIVPACFYQLDLFTGPVIRDLGTELYDKRLIASDNGGDKPCKETNSGSQVITHEQPSTTTTSVIAVNETVNEPKLADDTVTQTETTEAPEQIETPAEPVVLAAAETVDAPAAELAHTGINIGFLEMVAVFMVAIGVASILIGYAKSREARHIS